MYSDIFSILRMSQVFCLPEIVLVLVLSEWTDTETLTKFDSAVCNFKSRDGYLNLIEKPAFVTEGQVIGRSDQRDLAWMVAKRLQFKSMILTPSELLVEKIDLKCKARLCKIQSLRVEELICGSKIICHLYDTHISQDFISIIAAKCILLKSVYLSIERQNVYLSYVKSVVEIVQSLQHVHCIILDVIDFWQATYTFDYQTGEKTLEIESSNEIYDLHYLFTGIDGLSKVISPCKYLLADIREALSKHSPNLCALCISDHNSYSWFKNISQLIDWLPHCTNLQSLELNEFDCRESTADMILDNVFKLNIQQLKLFACCGGFFSSKI